MGESLVERPAAEKKMDESFNSSGGLEVSVSFGRFENDVLSWEKWSSFSPNKYLEEVGNLSTPGSVAQKKAYFEAHYKRIAARKAEELEQDMWMIPATRSLDESSNGDCVENSCKNDAELGLSDGQRSVEVAAEADYAATSTDATFVEAKRDDSFDSSKHDDNYNGDDIEVECENCLVEEANGNVVCLESNAGVEASPCEVEIPKEDARRTKERPPGRKNGTKQSTPKSNARGGVGEAQKVNSTKRRTNSTVIKPLPSSTPKYLKKASVSTPMAAASMKRENGLSVTKSKKAVSTMPLHMSLSLGPQSSLSAQSTTRKSLIMEKMGDKDIIRRAFKTFQNQACSDGISSTPKQVTSTASGAKISTPQLRTKGKEGVKSDAEKMSARRSQSGTRSNHLDTRSCRSSAVDKRNATAVSSAISFRSDERAEKRKEFLKNMEAKSIARAAENAQLSAKSKEAKECEMRKLRKSLNFKAKPLPSFYKDQTRARVGKDATTTSSVSNQCGMTDERSCRIPKHRPLCCSLLINCSNFQRNMKKYYLIVFLRLFYGKRKVKQLRIVL